MGQVMGAGGGPQYRDNIKPDFSFVAYRPHVCHPGFNQKSLFSLIDLQFRPPKSSIMPDLDFDKNQNSLIHADDIYFGPPISPVAPQHRNAMLSQVGCCQVFAPFPMFVLNGHLEFIQNKGVFGNPSRLYSFSNRPVRGCGLFCKKCIALQA